MYKGSRTKKAASRAGRRGVRPKKRFGQNFLMDEGVLDDIVSAAQITPEDTVLEIGPGTGNLTERLAAAAGRVIAVEVDEELEPVLRERFPEGSNVTIVFGDILKLSPEVLLPDAAPVKVAANLPYYITTPILMGLLESGLSFSHMTVMVQKEVARRMTAEAGTSDYGALSLAVQYYTVPRLVRDVPADCFYPRPKVDSALVHMRRRETPLRDETGQAIFFALVKAAFSQRRKTLVNALAQQGGFLSKDAYREILQALGWKEDIRGEMLTPEDFLTLSDAVRSYRETEDKGAFL